MGRARGSGNVFDAVIGRASGIPTPIMPTENIGMISGAIRKKGEDRSCLLYTSPSPRDNR